MSSKLTLTLFIISLILLDIFIIQHYKTPAAEKIPNADVQPQHVNPPITITQNPVTQDQITHDPTPQAENHDKLTSPNPWIMLSTDKYDGVEVEKPKSGNISKIFLTTSDDSISKIYIGEVENVSADHYHPAEYHNGSLYVLKKTGGNPDELWRGSLVNGKAVWNKIHSSDDFRVSDDERYVFIIDGSSLVFTDSSGRLFKFIETAEFPIDSHETPTYYEWDKTDTLWLQMGIGPNTADIIKIQTPSFRYETISLKDYKIGAEMKINYKSRNLVFSDYPVMFDTDTLDDFNKQKHTISLKVLNLDSKISTLITTSINAPFKPQFIDPTTIEYDDPNRKGRSTYKIK